MIPKIILSSFALLLAPLAGAETLIAGFAGALPNSPGWQTIGELPLIVVEDNGRKAIDFKDESETDAVALTYSLTEEQAIEVVSNGCTLSVQLRHVTNGHNGSNFRLLVRIPGYSSIHLSTFGDGEVNEPQLGSYDSVVGSGIGVPLLSHSNQDYTAIKAVFRPGAAPDEPGTLAVSLDGKPAFTLGMARAAATHARLEVGGMGGNNAVRTGQTLVSEVRLTTP